MKRLLFFLLLLLILINGCTYSNVNQGLIVSIPNDFSTHLFYSPTRDSINYFEIPITIENNGESAAAGAVFITGFDPLLLDIEKSNPPSKITICDMDTSFSSIMDHLDAKITANRLNIGFRCLEKSTTLSIGNIENFDVKNFLGVFMESIIGSTPEYKNYFSGIDGSFGMRNGKPYVNLWFDFDIKQRYVFGKDLALIIDAENLTKEGFGKGFFLEGKNRFNPNGDKKVIVFRGKVNPLPLESRKTYTKIMIDTIYGYTSFGFADLCVDPSPENNDRDVCRMTRYASINRGYPVRIERVSQEYAKDTLIYTITVRNVGNGRVLDVNALKKAPFKDLLQSYDLNKVRVVKLWFGNNAVDPSTSCTNDGVIYLDSNGRGSITCYYDLSNYSGLPAFQTSLGVELWYGYEQTITKNVVIEKIR